MRERGNCSKKKKNYKKCALKTVGGKNGTKTIKHTHTEAAVNGVAEGEGEGEGVASSRIFISIC